MTFEPRERPAALRKANELVSRSPRETASGGFSSGLPWRARLVFQHLAKEALSGSPVSVARDQDIKHIAVLVNRSPKIMTFAADRDEHFVHVPDVAEPALSSARSTSVRWSKLPAPGSNDFVGYGKATLSEKILEIAKAQSEAMVNNAPRIDFLRTAGTESTISLIP